MSGFQRSARPKKDTSESVKEIATVEKGADIPQRVKEQKKASKTVVKDPNAALTKNITVPANDYFLELIQKAAGKEQERTGYKVSGRMLCHKLLKEQLLKVIEDN